MDERDLKFTTSGVIDFTEYKVEKVDWNASVKKKANELVNSFRIILMNEDTECGNEALCTIIAKQCALNSIDEIIIALEHTDDCIVNLIEIPEFSCASAFYEDVREEIEKL